MEQKQKEKEIVDELLRSGTTSDMRIVGLINDLSLKADYYRKLAEGMVYEKKEYIYQDALTREAAAEARMTAALKMVEELVQLGYACFVEEEQVENACACITMRVNVGKQICPRIMGGYVEIKEEGEVEGAVFLDVSVGKQKWKNTTEGESK